MPSCVFAIESIHVSSISLVVRDVNPTFVREATGGKPAMHQYPRRSHPDQHVSRRAVIGASTRALVSNAHSLRSRNDLLLGFGGSRS